MILTNITNRKATQIANTTLSTIYGMMIDWIIMVMMMTVWIMAAVIRTLCTLGAPNTQRKKATTAMARVSCPKIMESSTN